MNKSLYDKKNRHALSRVVKEVRNIWLENDNNLYEMAIRIEIIGTIYTIYMKISKLQCMQRCSVGDKRK